MPGKSPAWGLIPNKTGVLSRNRSRDHPRDHPRDFTRDHWDIRVPKELVGSGANPGARGWQWDL